MIQPIFIVLGNMRKIISFVSILFISNWSSVIAQNGNMVHYETKDYIISFPGKPKKMTQNMSTSGGQLLLNIAVYEPNALASDDNKVYIVMETDYPETLVHSDKTEILDKFFRDAIDGMVKKLNYKLIKETEGQIGKYPSRTIEIDYKDGLAIMKMKLILFKNKGIIIQTVTETKKYSNSSSDKFFDSFELKTN